MESLSAAVTEKFDDEVRNLERAVAEIAAKERTVSENAAMLTHNKQMLASNRARIDALSGDNGSIKVYDRVVSTMRRYAAEAGIVTDFDEKDPQSVLSFLDVQLEDLVDMGGDSMTEVAPKVLKRLKKMVSRCCTQKRDRVYHSYPSAIMKSGSSHRRRRQFDRNSLSLLLTKFGC